MPTVADYMVLEDGAFTLDASSNATLERRFPIRFERPDGFVVGTNFAKPVLFYQVIPETSLSWLVAINDDFSTETEDVPQHQIHEAMSSSTPTWRTIHEPISGHALSDSVNTISFRAVSGRGRIADVVMLYQVQI